MKKILNIMIMGMFLFSFLPFVSADNEIQLGQPFHLGNNWGDAILKDIINGDRVEVRISVNAINPNGPIFEEEPSVEISWSFSNFEDEDRNIGNNNARPRAEGESINIYEYDPNIENINQLYELHILDINWNEAESARYAELRLDRIENDGIEPPLVEQNQELEKGIQLRENFKLGEHQTATFNEFTIKIGRINEPNEELNVKIIEGEQVQKSSVNINIGDGFKEYTKYDPIYLGKYYDYKLSIININWDEEETERYVELRLDQFNQDTYHNELNLKENKDEKQSFTRKIILSVINFIKSII